jgi:activator of HSP90 ATPase
LISIQCIFFSDRWHWEERNANDFAKFKLSELFAAVTFALSDGSTFAAAEVTKCTGEAYCNLRKGKKHYGHDMQMKLKFKISKDDQVVAEGSIEFPEVASDEPALQMNVNISKGEESLKQIVKNEGKAPFLQAHEAFKTSFHEVF